MKNATVSDRAYAAAVEEGQRAAQDEFRATRVTYDAASDAVEVVTA